MLVVDIALPMVAENVARFLTVPRAPRVRLTFVKDMAGVDIVRRKDAQNVTWVAGIVLLTEADVVASMKVAQNQPRAGQSGVLHTVGEGDVEKRIATSLLRVQPNSASATVVDVGVRKVVVPNTVRVVDFVPSTVVAVVVQSQGVPIMPCTAGKRVCAISTEAGKGARKRGVKKVPGFPPSFVLLMVVGYRVVNPAVHPFLDQGVYVVRTVVEENARSLIVTSLQNLVEHARLTVEDGGVPNRDVPGIKRPGGCVPSIRVLQ
mmetsp:Transcript_4260/g.6269  ORF Transcript_4260/g.6269 Transcript_4260/m.6269 type:complete len:262 (+) Transcript_4260:665-1450(+)